MINVHSRVIYSDFFRSVGSGTCDDNTSGYFLAMYPFDDDVDDWAFAAAPIDSHNQVCPSHRQIFDAIHYVCFSAKVFRAQESKWSIQLGLGELEDFRKCFVEVVANLAAYEHLPLLRSGQLYC